MLSAGSRDTAGVLYFVIQQIIRGEEVEKKTTYFSIYSF
ncbi:hypothetical protein LAC1533_0204 [Ligilactobacillus acidipiscis]|uniref:Uncharacterized protein n=1 Tax=Ligilactobacillus acidipiscis TaxID=89059 RepID=A0A1K1KL65_9LACO|nr:hypothetical protein LAC1533_0204 [Ligilactobacillus acidipiscis]